MLKSYEFLKKIIDSIAEHIVVLDLHGEILFTNRAWNAFAQENQCLIYDDWTRLNYLAVCDEAAKMGDEYGKKASAGIRDVIDGLPSFYFEYPCHSPDRKRWFMMTAKIFEYDSCRYCLISHINITERKIAEEYALNLSQVDGLTGLFNRRHFDLFFHDEWKRCSRLGLPITLAMIDIDHFKLLNDTYGHQSGDQCLIMLSSVIARYAKRPGDIAARYGGEEFVMVFGNSTNEMIMPTISELMNEIRSLNIPNRQSPTSPTLTVCMGIATAYPSRDATEDELIKKADTLLYKAKENGRNRIEY